MFCCTIKRQSQRNVVTTPILEAQLRLYVSTSLSVEGRRRGLDLSVHVWIRYGSPDMVLLTDVFLQPLECTLSFLMVAV